VKQIHFYFLSRPSKIIGVHSKVLWISTLHTNPTISSPRVSARSRSLMGNSLAPEIFLSSCRVSFFQQLIHYLRRRWATSKPTNIRV